MGVADRTLEATAEVAGPLRPLERSALEHPDPARGAEALYGALLERVDGPVVRARIVEVEAYGPDDPASHAYRGPTPRCASMFARPGTAYVYRSYGVHWCLNVSVGERGLGAAVLIRAAVLLQGFSEVRSRRPGIDDAGLLRGPGCTTRGLGIGAELDGTDLLAPTGPWRLMLDGLELPVARGPRVGVSQAAELAWRWHLPGSPAVSRYRRSPRA
jgi:DNA-3-methyladenine glycosylase